MSKVTPQLYIGSVFEAKNKDFLKSKHITHIVNATYEIKNFFPQDFVYLKLNLLDIPMQSLYTALEPAYKFITNAMGKGGVVLVHCQAGVSRSSSVVIYYLMKSKGWDYDTALKYLRSVHSKAFPNIGFRYQLRMLSSESRNMKDSGVAYRTRSSSANSIHGVYSPRTRRKELFRL